MGTVAHPHRYLSLADQKVMDNLEFAEATDIESGELKKGVRVKPEVRKQLLAGVSWKELQNLTRRKVYAIDCRLIHSDNEPCNLSTHKSAFRAFQVPADSICLDNDFDIYASDQSQISYRFTVTKGVSGNIQINLPSITHLQDGKEFVLGNQSKGYLGCCSYGRSQRISGNKAWIGHDKAVLLRKKEKGWEYRGEAGGYLDKPVATNPLLRESGAIVLCDQQVVNYENDGEYFLPRSVIEHTLDKKLKKQGDDFKYTYCESIDQLADSIKTAVAQDNYFVYENKENNHITAGCLKVIDNEVCCYLHETLGSESQHTLPLVDAVREEIRKVFPGKSIRVLLPAQRQQFDYASCGVMAIKAISYFYKYPEFMIQLFKHVKADNKGTYETVDVKRLPAGFIKLCQDESLIANHPDKELKVNSQFTLEQYLNNFSKEIMNEDRKKTVRAAALVKRYKYLMSYIKDHTVDSTVKYASTPEKNKRKRRAKYVSKVPAKKLSLDNTVSPLSASALKNREWPVKILHDHTYCKFTDGIQSQRSNSNSSTNSASSGYGSDCR